MKKMLIALFVTLVPLALFAQAPGVDKQPTDRPAVDRPAVDRTADLLKSFKLSDAQINQVRDIEKSTRTTIEAEFARLQLLNAQIKVALLPASGNTDLSAINKLIDQKAQLRADSEKALVAAEVQLTQIMGRDNFRKYFREARSGMQREGRFGMGGRGGMGGERGKGPMGDGQGPDGFGERDGMMGE